MKTTPNPYAVSIEDAVDAAVASPSTTFMFVGSPGTGKTFATKAILEAQGYTVRIISCQNLTVEDIAMIPRINEAGDAVQFLSNEIWKPTKKLVLVLDEISKATEEVFNTLNPLMFGRPRSIQGFEYGDDVIVICTGNPAVFAAGDRMRPHHVNRMVNLEIAPPTVEQAQRVLLNLGCDARIVQWVADRPQALVSYDANAARSGESADYWGYDPRDPTRPFCSMRSIETASRLINAGCASAVMPSLLAGAVGARAALSLTEFIRDTVKVTAKSITETPETATVPKRMIDQRLAAITAAGAMTPKNWENVLKYAKRLHVDIYEAVFWMHAARRTEHQKMVVSVPKYAKAVV